MMGYGNKERRKSGKKPVFSGKALKARLLPKPQSFAYNNKEVPWRKVK